MASTASARVRSTMALLVSAVRLVHVIRKSLDDTNGLELAVILQSVLL